MTVYTDLNQYEQVVRFTFKSTEVEGWQTVLGLALVKMGEVISEAVRTGQTQTWFDAITSEPSILFHSTGQIEFL